MAALSRTPRRTGFQRVGALWIALLFAAMAMFSAAPARAAHAPDETVAHCLEDSKSAPAKHPCRGDECCPLCGHSQKKPIFFAVDAIFEAVGYAPLRTANQRFRAFPSLAVEGVRDRPWAPPRAPPRFS